ncbi:hypothetical protein KAR91_05085, partial [Candidatus Pacearchaeota archaeon]|nr:hypothetical protein [Candidatus Pacearchaeota archaeon]
TSDKLLAIAEQAEKRVDALNKIKLIALRTTNVRDWTDHSGKPWLQESGATKVGRLFGVSWKIVGPELETYEDGHFNYTYQGVFSLADITMDAIGSRQSKDGFFNTRYKWDDTKKKMMPHDLPPSEIDKGDVKKAAWANCLARGITTILGIKNLTWEEIEHHTNIRKDQVTSIQYTKGKDKKKPLPQPTPKAQSDTKDERKDTGEGKVVGDPNIFIHCPRHKREILKKACPPCDERESCLSWAKPSETPKEEAEDPLSKFKGLKPRAFKKVLDAHKSEIPTMPREHQDAIKALWDGHFSGQPFPIVLASDPAPPAGKENKAEETELSLEQKEAKLLKLVEGSALDDMGVPLVPCPNRDNAQIKYTMCDPCMYKARKGCPTWAEFDRVE